MAKRAWTCPPVHMSTAGNPSTCPQPARYVVERARGEPPSQLLSRAAARLHGEHERRALSARSKTDCTLSHRAADGGAERCGRPPGAAVRRAWCTPFARQWLAGRPSGDLWSAASRVISAATERTRPDGPAAGRRAARRLSAAAPATLLRATCRNAAARRVGVLRIDWAVHAGPTSA